MIRLGIPDGGTADEQTHIDRINDEGPPAAIPGLGKSSFDPPERPRTGVRSPYRLTEKAFIEGRLCYPGQVLSLLPHEVGAHMTRYVPLPKLPDPPVIPPTVVAPATPPSPTPIPAAVKPSPVVAPVITPAKPAPQEQPKPEVKAGRDD